MSTNPGRIDKYELQELLRREGMVEVWKAFDTQVASTTSPKSLGGEFGHCVACTQTLHPATNTEMMDAEEQIR